MIRSLRVNSNILRRQFNPSCHKQRENPGKLLLRLRQVPSLQTTPCRLISTTPLPEFDNLGLSSHDELYRMSLEQPDQFWGTLARSRLTWFEDFSTVNDCDMSKGHIRWFPDGKINVSGRSNKHLIHFTLTLSLIRQFCSRRL